jgi:hypothetical protein
MKCYCEPPYYEHNESTAIPSKMMMSSSESYIENIPIFQSFGEKKECI